MGNSEPEWQVVSKDLEKATVVNKAGEQAHRYRCPRIQSREFEEQFCRLRTRMSQNVVRPLSYQVSRGTCSQAQSLEVVVEKGRCKLSEMNNLPLKQAGCLTKGVLKGYSQIINNFGFFVLAPEMVSLGEDMAPRVWMNENYAENRPSKISNFIFQDGQEMEARAVQSVFEIVRETVIICDKKSYDELAQQCRPQGFAKAIQLFQSRFKGDAIHSWAKKGLSQASRSASPQPATHQFKLQQLTPVVSSSKTASSDGKTLSNVRLSQFQIKKSPSSDEQVNKALYNFSNQILRYSYGMQAERKIKKIQI